MARCSWMDDVFDRRMEISGDDLFSTTMFGESRYGETAHELCHTLDGDTPVRRRFTAKVPVQESSSDATFQRSVWLNVFFGEMIFDANRGMSARDTRRQVTTKPPLSACTARRRRRCRRPV